MSDNFEPGRCYACDQDRPVRWKNLYTIGSEGTDLCLECELKVVDMLRNMARDAMRSKRDEYKAKKRRTS